MVKQLLNQDGWNGMILDSCFGHELKEMIELIVTDCKEGSDKWIWAGSVDWNLTSKAAYFLKNKERSITESNINWRMAAKYWKLVEKELGVVFKYNEEWREGRWLEEGRGYDKKSAQLLTDFIVVSLWALCKNRNEKGKRQKERGENEVKTGEIWVDLFCDAPWRSSNEASSGFVCFRKDDWQFTGCKKDVATKPPQVELKSILFGMQIARSVDWLKVYSDCEKGNKDIEWKTYSSLAGTMVSKENQKDGCRIQGNY
ncbi:hypothetical protein Cni_G26933 [Canna indica]|uniref:Uncharacterized protein n=1 Tax=Canna indica TaxID=4628 RepID=A0AAQ3L0N8_9LILI|nr:hypothetical protein Cni_G26933 [Canna indica]